MNLAGAIVEHESVIAAGLGNILFVVLSFNGCDDAISCIRSREISLL